MSGKYKNNKGNDPRLQRIYGSQNFLTSKRLLERIVRKSTITKNDIVLEIGSGKGHLKAKAKANAAQGIREMVGIASEKRFQENRKEKHSSDTASGWYYYTTRFAMPVYDNDVKT